MPNKGKRKQAPAQPPQQPAKRARARFAGRPGIDHDGTGSPNLTSKYYHVNRDLY